MRDPDGSIAFEGSKVIRHLRRPEEAGRFLGSALARQWVARGDLVPFEFDAVSQVVSPRLPFVTQPHEWCDAQLFEAGRLTLRLLDEALDAGFDLKDASAWNVIFAGSRPMFCDLLSFTTLCLRKWRPAGQFARHFVLPLVASRKTGLRAGQAFAVWGDGMPADTARRLLGPGRFATRYWPLVAGGAHDVEASPAGGAPPSQPDLVGISRFRKGLGHTLSWMLEGAAPAGARSGQRAGAWQSYVDDRSHYSAASLENKRAWVGEWLRRLEPSWVADLGCNTGEFSSIALDAGASVAAIDADHDAVQQVFRSHPGQARLYPVVSELDDLRGGRGSLAREHPGFEARIEQSFDLVLMLALVHHLAIAKAVPLDEVAALAAHCSRRWLVLELIDEADPQLLLLCRQRERVPAEFSVRRQREAFGRAGFVLREERVLEGGLRTLALLEKSSP